MDKFRYTMVIVSLQIPEYHVVLFSMFWMLVLGQLGKKGVQDVDFSVSNEK